MENRNLQKMKIVGQPYRISQFTENGKSQFTDNKLRYWPWRHQFSARPKRVSQFTDLLKKIAIIAIIAKIANIAIYAVPQLVHLQFSFINPLLTSVLITFDWSHLVHITGKSFHTIWKSKINGMLYPNLFLNNTEELPTCKLTCVGGKISLGLSMPPLQWQKISF